MSQSMENFALEISALPRNSTYLMQLIVFELVIDMFVQVLVFGKIELKLDRMRMLRKTIKCINQILTYIYIYTWERLHMCISLCAASSASD